MICGLVGIIDALGFEEFTFYDFGEFSFPFDVVLVLFAPGLEVSNQVIEFSLSLPDYSLDVFVLQSVLFDCFMDIFDMDFEVIQSLCFLIQRKLFLLTLLIWNSKKTYIAVNIPRRAGQIFIMGFRTNSKAELNADIFLPNNYRYSYYCCQWVQFGSACRHRAMRGSWYRRV